VDDLAFDPVFQRCNDRAAVRIVFRVSVKINRISSGILTLSSDLYNASWRILNRIPVYVPGGRVVR